MDSTVIGGIVRTVLAAGAGFLVAKGYGDIETWNSIIGGLIVIGTGAWSVLQKKKAAADVKTAAVTGEVPKK